MVTPERRTKAYLFAVLVGVITIAVAALWLVSSASATGQPAGANTPQGNEYAAPAVVTPSPSPCTATGNYTYTVSSGYILPGATLVPGSQCGICTVPVELPFPFTLYGQTYEGANAAVDGTLQFATSNLPDNSCQLPEPTLGPALMPHWDERLGTAWHVPCLDTFGSECGIYTQTTGVAPNRVFHIEWRVHIAYTSYHVANFAVRLFEGANTFEYIYGWVSYSGTNATIGVQDGVSLFTQYSCNTPILQTNRRLSWYPPQCGSTPSPTTPAITPTATPVLPTCFTIYDSITTADPTQVGMLELTGPSICQWNPTPPPVTDNLVRHRKVYRYHFQYGSFSTQCVTVRIEPTGCPGNLFSAAYVHFGSNTVYTGDLGVIPQGGAEYGFQIYRGNDFSIIVHEVTPDSGCSQYSMTVRAQFCYMIVTPTPSRTPLVSSTPINTGTPTRSSTPATGTPTRTGTSTTTRTPTQPASTATLITTPAGTATLTATSTATLTPTPCTITFSDVPPTHTFYPNIRCLACNGVLGGYSDGTFRPGNNITRGQIAKVVSNAAGFTEPVTGQTYTDVPTTQTFYEWIERLSARGVMGGYACGGPGEPCDDEGRAYFRPGADATRGQLSKIVANSAGLNDPVTGQFYTDVPTTHTFYTEIMRLTALGVMSGYQCGAVAGEPCDAENRPYFRPGAAVTRGQASKIVANTFFPGCTAPWRNYR